MAPPMTRHAHSMRRLSGAELGTDIDHNGTRTGTQSAGQEGNGPGSTGGRAQGCDLIIRILLLSTVNSAPEYSVSPTNCNSSSHAHAQLGRVTVVPMRPHESRPKLYIVY